MVLIATANGPVTAADMVDVEVAEKKQIGGFQNHCSNSIPYFQLHEFSIGSSMRRTDLAVAHRTEKVLGLATCIDDA